MKSIQGLIFLIIVSGCTSPKDDLVTATVNSLPIFEKELEELPYDAKKFHAMTYSTVIDTIKKYYENEEGKMQFKNITSSWLKLESEIYQNYAKAMIRITEKYKTWEEAKVALDTIPIEFKKRTGKELI